MRVVDFVVIDIEYYKSGKYIALFKKKGGEKEKR